MRHYELVNGLLTQNSLERATGLARRRLVSLLRANNIEPDFQVEDLGGVPNLHLFTHETFYRILGIAEKFRAASVNVPKIIA